MPVIGLCRNTSNSFTGCQRPQFRFVAVVLAVVIAFVVTVVVVMHWNVNIANFFLSAGLFAFQGSWKSLHLLMSNKGEIATLHVVIRNAQGQLRYKIHCPNFLFAVFINKAEAKRKGICE